MKSQHAVAFLLCAFLNSVAFAAEVVPFTPDALKKAQLAGATVVVDFHADWCPTCRTQATALRELAKEPAFAKVTFLTADFDEEGALKKELRVAAQSTVVIFKGQREITRAIGVTRTDGLRDLVKKGL